MTLRRYELRIAENYIIIADSDLTALQLTNIQVVSEHLLRSRLRFLDNRSTAEAIQAMLDQEEPHCQITIVPSNPDFK